jgi:3-deoxy-7-phosphoheptulonate synthase
VIVKLTQDFTQAEKEQLEGLLKQYGLNFRFSHLYGQNSFQIISRVSDELKNRIQMFKSVAAVIPFDKEFPLASRAYKNTSTTFCSQEQEIGGQSINLVAGPCSVESEEQILEIAAFLKKNGVKFIRGGAFKPRTSPYRFQGMGRQGLKLIREAANTFGLQVVTEVIDTSLIDETYEYADILQVGSRNMQNFYFLKQLGKLDKPILLKRGMYAPVEEWLMAAEYILNEGNEKVILCERGIRTFDTAVRNTMDIAAIPLIKELSHLPVWADPSHGTGRRDLIAPMSKAAVAAGADGLVIEIHPDPDHALSDGMQSIYLEQFEQLIKELKPIAEAVDRSLDTEDATNCREKINICVE